MICQVCGARLAREELGRAAERVPYGAREEEVYTTLLCPVCGSEMVSVVGECTECNGEFAKEELDAGLCRVCSEALSETLDWMWEQLSPSEKHWAIAHPEWMER